MKKEVLILYTTDPWHSHSGKEIVGVFSDRDNLEEYLQKLKRRRKVTEEDLDDLHRINQTQGRQMNYLVEEHSLNPTKIG